ncbi:ATP-binding cassette domain-containing protein [Streptococcus sp. E29BA]|uniref:ATP-binding cassette domain-containing protein n=1 Tax=Streptococcus sp. E29BA TaxID=3278716 RepID=UPI00359EBC95
MSITTYLLRCKRENAKLLFWLVLNSLCVLANGLLSAQALTNLVAQDVRAFLMSTGLNLLVYLLWMLQIKQIVPAREHALQAMNHEMRTDILTRLSQTNYEQFQRESADTYTSWLTNDILTINELGFETLELMLTQLLNLIFSAITLISYHPSFALSVLLLTGLMSLLPKRFEQKLADKALLFSEKNDQLLTSINHTLKGYGTLFGAGRLSELVRRVGAPEAAYAASRVSYQQTLGKMMATQNGLSFLSQLTILAQAGLLFAFNQVPIGAVSSSPYFASITFAGLTGFFANWAEVRSIAPIFTKFQNIPEATKSGADQITTMGTALTTHDIQLMVNEQLILDFPNITLTKGKHYRLMGPSGSGKSTLLMLLSGRLTPTTGQLTMDSLPARTRALTQLTTYVPQDSFIFTDTLRYNLTLGRTIPDEPLLDGLVAIGLGQWLAQLPDGLDSQISQESLSGGQAQRLSFLRGALEDKPIWLLDEITSALDPISRQTINAYLDKQQDKTILLVSHQESLNSSEKWIDLEMT